MSVFSSSLKTAIIDPQFHSESRCEFRLENRGQAYMPTLRIGNLGLSKTGATVNKYQFGAGTASVISRIRLMDGNEELDSLRNVAQWLTFKGALKSNSQNTNVFNNLSGDSQGWVYGETGELIDANTKQVRTGDDSTTGSLDLRECFGFLNSVSHLSTKLFPNLRVIIEYVPNASTQLLVNSQAGGDTANIRKVVPILICDEITDDALVATLDKQLTEASWVAVETDLSNMPRAFDPAGATVTTTATQRVNLRINGFQDKTVSRLMIAKCYEETGQGGPNVNQGTIGPFEVKALGGYGSKALHKEKFNLRLNGRNVLAGDGLVTPAQMTMMLSDTWGALNMCPFQNTENCGRDVVYSNFEGTPIGPRNTVGINVTVPSARSTAPGAGLPQQGYWISNSAWIGVPIQERVSDLQIDLERVATFSEGTSSSAGNYQSMNLVIFGEVAKGMSVSGGSYRVFYA